MDFKLTIINERFVLYFFDLFLEINCTCEKEKREKKEGERPF